MGDPKEHLFRFGAEAVETSAQAWNDGQAALAGAGSSSGATGSFIGGDPNSQFDYMAAFKLGFGSICVAATAYSLYSKLVGGIPSSVTRGFRDNEERITNDEDFKSASLVHRKKKTTTNPGLSDDFDLSNYESDVNLPSAEEVKRDGPGVTRDIVSRQKALLQSIRSALTQLLTGGGSSSSSSRLGAGRNNRARIHGASHHSVVGPNGHYYPEKNLIPPHLQPMLHKKQTLDILLEQLDELFLVMVVGEFNTGKSTLINSLLGGDYLPEGVLPTTDKIYKVQHVSFDQTDKKHKKKKQTQQNRTLEEVYLNVDWLKNITIVDTPGTNAWFQLGHDIVTERFIPHADLILFVTSAMKPLPQSELDFLSKINHWQKKLVLVVNKIDLLSSQSALDEVLYHVKEQINNYLEGVDVYVYPVSAIWRKRHFAASARRKQQQQQHSVGSGGDGNVDVSNGDGQVYKPQIVHDHQFHVYGQNMDMILTHGDGNMSELEQFIFVTLDDKERLSLKLDKPLVVADKTTDEYQQNIIARESVLIKRRADLQTIQDTLKRKIADLKADFNEHWIANKDSIFNALEDRAVPGFVEGHLNFWNWKLLSNPHDIAEEFKTRVILDAPMKLDERIARWTDWLARKITELDDEIIGVVSDLDFGREVNSMVYGNLHGGHSSVGMSHGSTTGMSTGPSSSAASESHRAEALIQQANRSQLRNQRHAIVTAWRHRCQAIVHKLNNHTTLVSKLLQRARMSIVHTSVIEAVAATLGYIFYSSAITWYGNSLDAQSGGIVSLQLQKIITGTRVRSIVDLCAKPMPLLCLFLGSVGSAALGPKLMHFNQGRSSKDILQEFGAVQDALKKAMLEQFEQESGQILSNLKDMLEPCHTWVETEASALDAMKHNERHWRRCNKDIKMIISHVMEMEEFQPAQTQPITEWNPDAKPVANSAAPPSLNRRHSFGPSSHSSSNSQSVGATSSAFGVNTQLAGLGANTNVPQANGQEFVNQTNSWNKMGSNHNQNNHKYSQHNPQEQFQAPPPHRRSISMQQYNNNNHYNNNNNNNNYQYQPDNQYQHFNNNNTGNNKNNTNQYSAFANMPSPPKTPLSNQYSQNLQQQPGQPPNLQKSYSYPERNQQEDERYGAGAGADAGGGNSYGQSNPLPRNNSQHGAMEYGGSGGQHTFGLSQSHPSLPTANTQPDMWRNNDDNNGGTAGGTAGGKELKQVNAGPGSNYNLDQNEREFAAANGEEFSHGSNGSGTFEPVGKKFGEEEFGQQGY